MLASTMDSEYRQQKARIDPFLVCTITEGSLYNCTLINWEHFLTAVCSDLAIQIRQDIYTKTLQEMTLQE